MHTHTHTDRQTDRQTDRLRLRLCQVDGLHPPQLNSSHFSFCLSLCPLSPHSLTLPFFYSLILSLSLSATLSSSVSCWAALISPPHSLSLSISPSLARSLIIALTL